MENKRKRYFCISSAAVLFIILFIAGSFYDLAIAEAVYFPQNTAALILTIAGVYIFLGSFVFFIGALCRQFLSSDLSRRKKLLCCVICGYLGLSTGTICSAGMMNYEGVGMLFPDTRFSFGAIFLVNIIAVYPLFFAGLAVNGKRCDPVIIKRIISLLILLTAAFLIPQVIKHSVQRPRYRMTLMGYDDIAFTPWYKPFSGVKELMEKYGLDSNAFGSFPSGHALSAVLNVIIFPALVWVVPGLKGKEKLFCILGSLSCIAIIISRMVLGAHYLSDVAFGGLLGIGLAVVFFKVQENINKNKER